MIADGQLAVKGFDIRRNDHAGLENRSHLFVHGSRSAIVSRSAFQSWICGPGEPRRTIASWPREAAETRCAPSRPATVIVITLLPRHVGRVWRHSAVVIAPNVR